MTQFRTDASKIKGISKVKTSYDFSNYIFKIQFSYATVESLNMVLNSIDKTHKGFTHFKNNKDVFERISYNFV